MVFPPALLGIVDQFLYTLIVLLALIRVGNLIIHGSQARNTSFICLNDLLCCRTLGCFLSNPVHETRMVVLGAVEFVVNHLLNELGSTCAGELGGQELSQE